jgi:hypothetical protein
MLSFNVERARFSPKTVLIAPYNVQGWLYRPLIAYMRERWNTRIVMLVPANGRPPDEYRDVCGPEAVLEPVPDFEPMARACLASSDDAAALAEAHRIERAYGINYTVDVYQQERDIAWSLVSGAPHRVGRAAPWRSPANCARTVNAYFKHYEALFDRHAIDVALVWPRTAHEAVCAIVAENRGKPVTYPYTAKYKEYAYWAADAACGNQHYRQAYEATGECEPLKETEVAPPARPENLVQSRIRWRYSLWNTIRQTLVACIDRVLLLRGDLREGRFGRANRLPLSVVVRRLWLDWRYFREFNALCEHDLEKVTASPYVFYAFQNEPEFSVQMRCKEFNDQGAIVRQLALSLPAGVKLVLKEHTWLGSHRIQFYRDLLSLPNVIMAHPEQRAIDLVPKALVTVSLGGTVTLEAAFYGRPAIIFGARSEFAVLPSVRVVRALDELPSVIRGLQDWDEAKQEVAKRGAARFARATEIIGVEAKPYFTKDGSKLRQDQVERAADLLQKLLEQHRSERGGAHVNAE